MASARPAKRARLEVDPSAQSRPLADDEFDRLTMISQGSNGVLYKARRRNGEIVALKRMVHHRWLVQPRNPDRPSVLRVKRVLDHRCRTEVDSLTACRHPNVVRLEKVVAADSTGSTVFLVMDYAYTDLQKILDARSRPFTEGEAKFLMLQLLRGIKSIHDQGILHGDLKPRHILVDHVGDLKICDLGGSRKRETTKDEDMKSFATLSYMPPELLLGVDKKAGSVSGDMWSLGCIMAQLLNNQVLFPGTSKDEHLRKMFQVLGTPDVREWPAVSTVPDAAEVIRRSPRQWCKIRHMFPATHVPSVPTLSRDGYHLLRDLLVYDPKRRITVDGALQHPWFRPSLDGSSGPPAVKPRCIVSPAVDFADALDGPPPPPPPSSSSSMSAGCRNKK